MNTLKHKEITNYFQSKLENAINETLKDSDIYYFDKSIYGHTEFWHRDKADIEFVKEILYIIKDDLLFDFICKLYIEYLYHINIDLFIEKNGIPLRGKCKEVIWYFADISKRKYENGKKDIPGNFNILEATGISGILIRILADTRFGNNIFIESKNLKNIYEFLSTVPKTIKFNDIPEIGSKYEKDIKLVESGCMGRKYSSYIDFISKDPIRLYLLENYLKTSYINTLLKIGNRFSFHNFLGLRVIKTFDYICNKDRHIYDIEHYANHHLPLTAEKISTLLSYYTYFETNYINLLHVIYVIIPKIFDTFSKCIAEKPLSHKSYKCQIGIEKVFNKTIDDIIKTFNDKIKFCGDIPQIEDIFRKYKMLFNNLNNSNIKDIKEKSESQFEKSQKIIMIQLRKVKTYIRKHKNLDLINDANLSNLIEEIKSEFEKILDLFNNIIVVLDYVFCVSTTSSYEGSIIQNTKNTVISNLINSALNDNYCQNDEYSEKIISVYLNLHEYEMIIDSLIYQLNIKHMNHIYVIHDFLHCDDTVNTYTEKYKPITDNYKSLAKDETYKNIFLKGIPYLYCIPEKIEGLNLSGSLYNQFFLIKEITSEYVISKQIIESIYNLSTIKNNKVTNT